MNFKSATADGSLMLEYIQETTWITLAEVATESG